MTSPLPPGPERLRRFRDAQNVDWTVWEVDAEYVAESAHRLVYIDPRLAGGWLAFESADGDRCRLAPIPVGWQVSSDEQLRGLLARAEPVRAQRTTVETPVVDPRRMRAERPSPAAGLRRTRDADEEAEDEPPAGREGDEEKVGGDDDGR